jgi:hypothetical protein
MIAIKKSAACSSTSRAARRVRETLGALAQLLARQGSTEPASRREAKAAGDYNKSACPDVAVVAPSRGEFGCGPFAYSLTNGLEPSLHLS